MWRDSISHCAASKQVRHILVMYHLHPGDIFLHPRGLELVLLSVR
jgi:hypothetical protein